MVGMSARLDSCSDFLRVFRPAAYRSELYDRAYTAKADEHALNEASRAEIDWVVGQRPDAGHVVDIGCSTGHPLASMCARWNSGGTGLDVNDLALERARRHHPELSFRKLDGVVTGLDDGCADHVAIHHVLAHVPDPEATLREAHRVLAPGGTLSIISPNARYKIWQFPMNFVGGFQPDVTVLRYYSAGSLRRILERTGFTVQKIETRGPFPDLCPPWFHDAARLRLMVIGRKP